MCLLFNANMRNVCHKDGTIMVDTTILLQICHNNKMNLKIVMIESIQTIVVTNKRFHSVQIFFICISRSDWWKSRTISHSPFNKYCLLKRFATSIDLSSLLYGFRQHSTLTGINKPPAKCELLIIQLVFFFFYKKETSLESIFYLNSIVYSFLKIHKTLKERIEI